MNVLVVDDEPVVRRSLDRAIPRVWRDARVASVASLLEAERVLEETRPDVVTVDLALSPEPSELGGLRLVERLGERAVVVTGRRDAVDAARRAGARVVLFKPFGHAELREAGRELGIPLVGEPEPGELALASLVGPSKAMRELREHVRQVDRENGPVLIQGETGTGKELVARAIHAFRGRGPFHALNCSTLEGLADSQLFGHARGAFTSAERAARGALEQAGVGVLFLDEIVDLPKSAQAKLLRALEGKKFQAVGGEAWIELMARLLSACNGDLEAHVAEGRFREDLFYRVAVHIVRIPPLRERTEDIPSLADVLLGRLARPKRITEDALAVLAVQRWPGNVRQLAAVLERAAVRTDEDAVDADDVLAVLGSVLVPSRALMMPGPVKVQVVEPLGRYDVQMEALTRRLFEQALDDSKGNVAAAARRLGVNRMMVTRWLRRGPR